MPVKSCKLLTFLCIFSYVNTQDFEGIADPYIGVTYYDGLYYAVTSEEYMPIYVSPDLDDWSYVSSVFDVNTSPPWYFFLSPPFTPDIQILKDGEFRVYFSAINDETLSFALGAASSNDILGPYSSPDTPLLSIQELDFFDPTILNNDGELYILYSDEGSRLYGRNLTNDGMAVAYDKSTTVLQADLSWESPGPLSSPAIIRRGDYSYIFYTAADTCNTTRVVGVARSKNPLGPYEKMSTPFLEDMTGAARPGYAVATKGVEQIGGEEYDMLIYQAWDDVQSVCQDLVHLYTARVDWGPDDWPIPLGNSTMNRIQTNLPYRTKRRY